MCSQMNMQSPCHMHICFTQTALCWASRTLYTRAKATNISNYLG